jgi:hypothetical protein
MSYSVYQSLLDQAQIDGWIGVGMMTLAVLLGFLLVPWLFHRAKMTRMVAGGDGGSLDIAAMIVIFVSVFLLCYGASQARWLLNPRGYAIEHARSVMQ